MEPRVLSIGADPKPAAALGGALRPSHPVDRAPDSTSALEQIKASGPFAVVVAQAEEVSREWLMSVAQLSQRPEVILIASDTERRRAEELVKIGMARLVLSRDCSTETLASTVAVCTQHHELDAVREARHQHDSAGFVRALSEMLGMISPEALSQGQKLRDSIRTFAASAPNVALWELEAGALLSLVGYASLPRQLINKIHNLDELGSVEERLVASVPQLGHDLLCDIPSLEGPAKIILYQDHPYSGPLAEPGEPAGAQLPVGARMLKILKARLRLEGEGIVKRRAHEVMSSRGAIYDPRLLEECFTSMESFLVTPVSKDRPVHEVSLREITVNQIPVMNITTPEGLVLLSAGSPITPVILKTLRNYSEIGELSEPLFVQDAA